MTLLDIEIFNLETVLLNYLTGKATKADLRKARNQVQFARKHNKAI